jgi:hypothetical protein
MLEQLGQPAHADAFSSIIRGLLLGTGGMAAGLLLYLAVVRFRALLRWKRPFDLAYLMFDVGVAITKVIIDELVFHSPNFPLSWRVVFYTFGEALIFIGVLGVALHHRRVNVAGVERQNGGGIP